MEPEILTVRSCAISSGGNPVKPSIEFDTRHKRCVALTTPVCTKFIKNSITPKFIQKYFD